MNKEEYYEVMSNMSPDMDFKKIHKLWYNCFKHILISFNAGHNEKTIRSLFYDFDMENWKAMHKENTEYTNNTNEELIENFCGECMYISDRTSYDRLFRAHWLFKQSFDKELFKIKYPEL